MSGTGSSGTGKGGRRGVRKAIENAQPAQPSPPAGGGVPAYLAAVFTMKFDGLHRNSDDPLKSFWICSPFEIEAELRDAEGDGWGVLISWHDRDGIRHEEAFSRTLFTGECAELRARLAHGGLSMGGRQNQRQALAEYLNVASCVKRARSVSRVGWHQIGGGAVHILPGITFGAPGERVVLQTESREPSLFNVSGTAGDWRDNVGLLCVGNSRLIFAASCGFAAPVLGIVGEDGGGFNLRGASRIGKSTALRVAASVCGGTPGAGAAGFIRQWRATGNGLESVAAAHSDNLLLLDEMGQVDGRECGEVAYMLANGTGKTRAHRSGMARPAERWRVLFLSTGEIGLADKMAEAGLAGPKAGMEVRLADLPADAGKGLGVFEDLHDEANADAFIGAIREGVTKFYGAPLHGFLAMLTDRWRCHGADFPEVLRSRAGALLRDWLSDWAGVGGQVRSVGFRFALVGTAGELATETALTGWSPGAAAEAARACFRAWISERGTLGAREDARAVAQLRAFISQNGSARFEIWGNASRPDEAAQVDDDSTPPTERFRTMKRAGWRRFEAVEGGRPSWCYYLTADGMNEALAGLAPKESKRILAKQGYLILPNIASDVGRGNTSAAYAVPGHGKVRLYRINPAIMASTEGDD